MDLKTKKMQVKKNMFKRVVVEEPQVMEGKKARARQRIHNEVFDLYDSVADNAKSISLIFVLLSLMWDALDEETKARIPEEKRQIIEYAFQKYHSIQTRADICFATEGAAMIDRLMDRQNLIGRIIKEEYKIQLSDKTSE